MTGLELAQLSVLTIFSVNTVLFGTLVALKVIHRRRMQSHDRRRQSYVALLSRHVAFEHCTDPIPPEMADDPAFVDALIDVRNAVAGAELATLRQIVSRHGVVMRQVENLQSSFPLGRRLRAAVALAEIGDESSAPVLMAHLDDREPEIRIQSARGLGRIRWTSAIERIMRRFSIETPWVRMRFSDTLTTFGSSATWPLLAYVRVNQGHETEGPKLALRTLAQIEDREAVGPIIDILRESTNLEIQIGAIEALGELGSPEAIWVLSDMFVSDHWELRAKAATAFGRIGDTSVIPLLVSGLQDPEWWVRRNTAAALAQMPAGIATLYDALGNEDEFAADAAAEALTDIGELVAARHRLEEKGGDGDEALIAYHRQLEGVGA